MDEIEGILFGGVAGIVIGSSVGTAMAVRFLPAWLGVPLGCIVGAYVGGPVGAVAGLGMSGPLDRLAEALERRAQLRRNVSVARTTNERMRDLGLPKIFTDV